MDGESFANLIKIAAFFFGLYLLALVILQIRIWLITRVAKAERNAYIELSQAELQLRRDELAERREALARRKAGGFNG